MLLDAENMLSNAQAFTGAATVSTNSYAKQTAAQDLSIGRRVALVVMPTVNAGAGSTQTLEAIEADDAALTVNVTALASVVVLAAVLIKGARIEIPIPQAKMARKYIGFRHTATGGTTTLTADVAIVPQDEIPAYKSFPKAVDVLV